MAAGRDNKEQGNKKKNFKQENENTAPTPLCVRCSSSIDNGEIIKINGKTNQIELDAIPRFHKNKTFSDDDDEQEWRQIEETEKRHRQDWESKKQSERERQRIDNVLNQPSTSRSHHLEEYITRNESDGISFSNKNVFDSQISNSGQQRNLTNYRALRADAETYQLETFEKNIMLIFNHYNIDSYTKPREGTHKDVEALRRSFSKYNFKIIVHPDKTRDEIFAILNEFCQDDFSDYGCIAVVVLTHGWDGGILFAKDLSYNESDLISKFETHKNPSLVTKPKLFIFQACRGRHPSQSVNVSSRTVRLDGEDEDFFYTLPIECDILILHSTYPGNASHRETENGSWMIQTLCARIDELADKHDMLSIVTTVQRDVAIDKENMRLNKWTSDNRIDKQMPIMTSTLIRKLELRKFLDKPIVVERSNLTIIAQTEIDSANVNGQSVNIDLHYFNYIKRCTATYARETENLNDMFAKCLISVADTFGSGEQFDHTKIAMANAMCDYLENSTRNKEAYKYLYLKRC